MLKKFICLKKNLIRDNLKQQETTTMWALLQICATVILIKYSIALLIVKIHKENKNKQNSLKGGRNFT